MSLAKVLFLAVVTGLSAPALAQDAPAADETAERPEANRFEGSAIGASLVIRVSDKKAAAEATIAKAQARSGWFTHFEPTRVDVRVPTDQTDALLEELTALGDLVDRSYNRQDHSLELSQLEARIAGREKVLKRYREVLEGSKARNIVAVERQITQAIQELERLEGRKRFLDNQLAHSTVSVSFQFRDRSAPRRDGSSSFAWLNTMNMADLIQDFRRGRRSTPSKAETIDPEGFAVYRKSRRFQAVTADNVVFRIRSAKNKPEADLDFWKEALKERQVAAGYTVLDEAMMGENGTYLLKLGAANGPQDQTYVIGLRVKGKQLILAEATGAAEAFEAHDKAVRAAIDAVR